MSLLMFRKYAPAHAADAHIDDITYKYKVGDKIKTPDGVGTVQKKTHTNSGKPAYEVKLDKGGVVVYFEQSVSADAADAAAQFKVGDKIWVDPSYGANLNIGYGWNVGIVKRVGTGNIDVDFKGQVISVPAPYCARVNSSGKPVFDSAAMDGRGDIRMTLHAAESQIAGVVNVFTNHAVDKTEKEIAAIDELKGVIGIIHKVASVNEFNRLVDSAKDAADADKSEELEREIKGDVVAVVSGNAARVSKDVPFATAKEGVESFARKNGVSVVASQEYGEAYKFKFSAAIDCAAADAREVQRVIA